MTRANGDIEGVTKGRHETTAGETVRKITKEKEI
jgi:hypothetical protein